MMLRRGPSFCSPLLQYMYDGAKETRPKVEKNALTTEGAFILRLPVLIGLQILTQRPPGTNFGDCMCALIVKSTKLMPDWGLGIGIWVKIWSAGQL